MPGVSFVTGEFYRGHLERLRTLTQRLRTGCEPVHRKDVSFHARILMRSDAADVTDAERLEAERLIDESAGLIARMPRV